MTITLTKIQIPLYLNGTLSETIDSDEPFDVPNNLFRETIIIENTTDLYMYINILDYWGVDNIPDEMYKWILQNKTWEEDIPDKFYIWLFANIKFTCKNSNINYCFNDKIQCIINSNTESLCNNLALLGYSEILKIAHSCGYSWSSQTLYNAATHNAATPEHLECFIFAHTHGCPSNFDHKIFKSIINMISMNGNLPFLKYLYENRDKFDIEFNESYYKNSYEPNFWNEDEEYDAYEFHLDAIQKRTWDQNYWNEVTNNAAIKGHIHILEYAIENKFPIFSNTCNTACNNGHIEYLKFAHANGCMLDTCKILYHLPNTISLEIIIFLHELGCILNKKLGFNAIATNNIAILNYVCQNIIFNKDDIQKLFIDAVKYNNLECIQCLHSFKYEWISDIYYLAAQGGKLDIIKYAYESGCPWHIRTCEGAAENGHLNILKYAHEHGCPWDPRTCTIATCNDHFECLVYAHDNGCPWNSSVYKYAKKYKRTKILKYAIDNRCPLNK